MSTKDRFDTEIDGQFSLEDFFDNVPQKLVAVSRIFARAKKSMSLAEQKTFIYALSQLKFKQKPLSNVVYMDKKTLAHICGVNSNPDHLSVHLFEKIKDLPKHSFIEISDKDRDLYDSGVFITRITMLKNRVKLKFEEDYLPLFTNLTTGYITMWSTDIFGLTSERSVRFYEFLRQNTDTRRTTNEIGLGIKALKEMFDIPKDGSGSYVSKEGHFLRTSFEKKVIDPVCADLFKTKMICLSIQSNGKGYEKVKKGNRVAGYRFFWTFSAHPAVASAEEVHQLQERVDKNPKILKVARDLVSSGNKKSQKKIDKDGYNSFDQRKYDYDELERQLANCPNN